MCADARANVWEPERPALSMKTFTGRQYIVSPPRCGADPGKDTMSRDSKDHTKTVQIRKVDKVAPDHRGRSVWLGKVEPVELELVSTTALEKILKTGGGGTRSEIRKLAAGRKNGLLARDTATGHFRILSDADLRKAATTPPPGDGPKRSGIVAAAPLTESARRKADELSLVSTQILRKVVKPGDEAGNGKPKPAARKDKFGGFNPYDNN